MWFKILLSLSNITHLFPMYIRISSTILKFLQVVWKLAVFPLLVAKFSILLKSTCLLHAIFLRFIFNQKEKRGFIWSETFNFLLNLLIFIHEKKRNHSQFSQNLCKTNINLNFLSGIFLYFLYFLETPIKRNTFECLVPLFQYRGFTKNVKIPHPKII